MAFPRAVFLAAAAAEAPEADAAQLAAWADRLAELYDGDDGPTPRRYHTGVHVAALIAQLDAGGRAAGKLSVLSRNEWVLAAVVRPFLPTVPKEASPISADLVSPRSASSPAQFHDAIYDAKSSTNEEDSARLYSEFARDVGAAGRGGEDDAVVRVILATKSHAQPPAREGDDDGLAADFALFLDADVSILAAEGDAYWAYADQIHTEYGHMSDEAYCSGRAAVLRKFLARERIFLSQLFYDALEARARANLAAEIAELDAGRLPTTSG